MSGPDINRPRPGSNAIGKFIIGVSPIGDIPSFDFWDTIISQYANSPTITALIESFFDCVDQTNNMSDFFDNVMNIETAQGQGLDVWGRIVGVSRTLQLPQSEKFFGFEEQSGVTVSPFNQSAFFSGESLTNNFQLSDQAYRALILAKAFANISDGSVPSLNKLLLNLFPNRGNCFVTDDGDMTMTYTFNFPLSPVEAAIVIQSGVLPKPAGVTMTIVQNFPTG